jgi:hypothetical protein
MIHCSTVSYLTEEICLNDYRLGQLIAAEVI